MDEQMIVKKFQYDLCINNDKKIVNQMIPDNQANQKNLLSTKELSLLPSQLTVTPFAQDQSMCIQNNEQQTDLLNCAFIEQRQISQTIADTISVSDFSQISTFQNIQRQNSYDKDNESYFEQFDEQMQVLYLFSKIFQRRNNKQVNVMQPGQQLSFQKQKLQKLPEYARNTEEESISNLKSPVLYPKRLRPFEETDQFHNIQNATKKTHQEEILSRFLPKRKIQIQETNNRKILFNTQSLQNYDAKRQQKNMKINIKKISILTKYEDIEETEEKNSSEEDIKQLIESIKADSKIKAIEDAQQKVMETELYEGKNSKGFDQLDIL